MESESGFIEIGHASIYFETAGEGQPLVLIHAGVTDSRQWNKEFAYFAQKFRVLRYDLRGFGKSLPVEGEFNDLEILINLLDQLGFDQPLVAIGCSMGGTLAMDFALADPTRVNALVMVGSGPSGLSLDVPDHPNEVAAEEAYNAGNLDLVAELNTQIWFDGMGRTSLEVDQQMRQLVFEMDRLALSHDAMHLGKRLPNIATPAFAQLDKLLMPVLILVGEYDIPYLQVAADYMLESIPSVRKEIIEDAAHLPNMDQPEHFQKIIQIFLDEIPSQPQ